MRRVFLLIVCCTTVCLHSDTPKISIEQQAQWLQARAELAEAKNALLAAEQKYSQIVVSLQAVCPLVLKDGRPECAIEAPKKN